MRRLLPEGTNPLTTASVDIHPLIDTILDELEDEWSGGDIDGWAGYRNHCQRVLIFGRHLTRAHASIDPDTAEKIAIASAFHDLAVFQTVDYLVLNNQSVKSWLEEYGKPHWYREIALAMTMHHRARPYRGDGAWLVEAIRRADWIECTAGLVRPGVPAKLVHETQNALPMGRFARFGARSIITHALTHPLDPAPFARSRRARRII